MRKANIYISIVFLSLVLFNIDVHADSIIKLDGDFSDWKGMPFFNDPTNDAPLTEDIKSVKYYREDNTLYLYVSKTNGYNNPWYNWYFQVVFRNAPYGNKYYHLIFQGNKLDFFLAPVMSVNVRELWNVDRPDYAVTVSGDKGEISTTFSASNDLRDAEFSIPLNVLGITKNDKVTCYVKSNISASFRQIEWAPDKKPIVIDYGPTLWVGTFFFFFIFVFYLASKAFNKI